MAGNLPFLLCFTLYLRAISKYKAPGGLYLEGRFNGGFFALRVWGAYIWRGLYMEELIFGILRYTSKGYVKLIYLHRPQDGCGVGKLFRRFGNIQEFIEKRYDILARIGFVIIYTALQIYRHLLGLDSNIFQSIMSYKLIFRCIETNKN